jgi:hypothetical protein
VHCASRLFQHSSEACNAQTRVRSVGKASCLEQRESSQERTYAAATVSFCDGVDVTTGTGVTAIPGAGELARFCRFDASNSTEEPGPSRACPAMRAREHGAREVLPPLRAVPLVGGVRLDPTDSGVSTGPGKSNRGRYSVQVRKNTAERIVKRTLTLNGNGLLSILGCKNTSGILRIDDDRLAVSRRSRTSQDHLG